MPVASHISVEEYLNTTYRPDCDYVDGNVVERNLGERKHARAQILSAGLLRDQEQQHQVLALTEQRVQVSPTRYRIPDVCVLAPGAPDEEIVRYPPILCVEILSKDDTMTSIMERVEEYLAMGVPNVWVIDPRLRRGYQFTPEGMHEPKDGILRTSHPELRLPLAQIFE